MARVGETFLESREALLMAKAFISVLYDGAVETELSSPEGQASIQAVSEIWTHGEQTRKLITCCGLLGEVDLEGRISDVFEQIYGNTPPPMEEITAEGGNDGGAYGALRAGLHAIHYKTPAFSFTKGGYMGFGPHRVKDGDKVFVPFGCPTPLVVRPCESGETYAVVRYCYIYGMMEGEIVVQLEEGMREAEVICLV